MPEITEVSPSSLEIDLQNPRLSAPSNSQREAIREIASQQKSKLTSLASDIVKNGLNPSELVIATPIEGKKSKFLVLEGNRRITALKLLENPETAAGAVDNSVLKKLRELSEQYRESPIEYVNVCVLQNREEAAHWIELKHTGQNQGAGLVAWANEETSRFRARTSQLPPHIQLLEMMVEKGHLSPSTARDCPATSLQRLTGDPSVRSALGIRVKKNNVDFIASQDKSLESLASIAQSLADKTLTLKEIYTKEDRAQFAKTLPDVTTGKAVRRSKKKPSKKTATKKKATIKHSKKKRATLIPDDCDLHIDDPRVEDIAGELRQLNLETFSNAVSVLFRVFIELSCDNYLKKHEIEVNGTKLKTKMQEVVNHLKKSKLLSEDQAKPVRRACTSNQFLAPSIDTFHNYVHNRYFSPTPTDLRNDWNSLQPFLVAMWS